MSNIKGNYPSSEHYSVHDTIGVPHPYCIGPRHVGIAADHFNGMLGKEAIEYAEKKGIHCDICKGKLSHKEHKTALLVKCTMDPKEDDGEELKAQLELWVPECKANNYVGFTLMDSFSKKGD